MTGPESDNPKKRLNLDMGPRYWQRLEELAAWTDRSNAETVRQLIRMHHHLAVEMREGATLLLRRADGTEAEIVVFVNEDE